MTSTTTQPLRLPATGAGMSRPVAMVMAMMMFLAIFAGSVAKAGSAEAASGSCNSYSCTVYLDKNETIALSKGKVPALGFLGRASVPMAALLYGHRFIAAGWVNRKACVAFRISYVPWVSQGMMGHHCKW